MKLNLIRLAGVFILLIVLFIALGVSNPGALSQSNLYDVFNRHGALGVITLGAALLIITGAIDLSIGSVVGFSAEFMRKLPLVEQAMVTHGLEPAQFVISKDRATPPSVPFIGPFFYDYTVFFGDDNFTVTEPNDMVFLDYFNQRCIAEDETAGAQAARPPGLINRIFRWMAQPVR